MRWRTLGCALHCSREKKVSGGAAEVRAERAGIISRSICVPDACLIKGVACDGNSIGTSKISKHFPLAVQPAQRLPGMAGAGILRERGAHGSRRCLRRQHELKARRELSSAIL